MIQYILECIAFQLVFLVIYDFMLKRETFFQWNRAYLIGTYILSLGLPWIKIEALKSSLPERYFVYPELLMNIDVTGNGSLTEGPRFNISWEETILFGGMFFAAIYFGYKLFQIYRLRKNGAIQHFSKFTRILIANSQIAFSFFRSIFLGDKVLEREHQSIIQHELVHIEQKHSWDLLFFELMRIIGWFNPLVYVYQQRVSELHEFIADSHVAKTHKKEQYEVLLSQIFETENISFINQFFKSSLIKKRIVMLQKARSKKVWQLKYLMLVPLVLGMLAYTSCEQETGKDIIQESITVGDIENLTNEEENQVFQRLMLLSENQDDWQLFVKDGNSTMRFVPSEDESYISGLNGERIKAKLAIDSKLGVFIDKSNLDQTTGTIKHAQTYSEEVMNKYQELLDKRRRLSTSSMDDNSEVKSIDKQLRIMLKGSNLGGTSSWPFFLVDEVPVFPGCENVADKRNCFEEKLRKHIVSHFKYPKEAQEKGIQGRVLTNFVIDELGNITQLKKKGPDASLEAEAERIINLLPKLRPGKQQGKVTGVSFSLPITFKLQ